MPQEPYAGLRTQRGGAKGQQSSVVATDGSVTTPGRVDLGSTGHALPPSAHAVLTTIRFFSVTGSDGECRAGTQPLEGQGVVALGAGAVPIIAGLPRAPLGKVMRMSRPSCRGTHIGVSRCRGEYCGAAAHDPSR